jgi:hypothetical protein
MDPVVIKTGDKISYTRHDSGQVLANGLYLKRGEELEVGKDVDAQLAQRLVDEGRCGIVVPPSPPTE